jgi:hypothetical protein
MNTRFATRVLRLAAVGTLLALALMVWGVVDTRPISLVIAMSVGQALGTLSFAVFCFVVSLDLRGAHIFSGTARRSGSDTPGESDPTQS